MWESSKLCEWRQKILSVDLRVFTVFEVSLYAYSKETLHYCTKAKVLTGRLFGEGAKEIVITSTLTKFYNSHGEVLVEFLDSGFTIVAGA